MKRTDLTNDEVPDYLDKMRLVGKTFVVIGAGQGIGRQTAHALSQAGARVVCVGRGRSATEAIAREVDGIPCIADATRRDDVERVFAETLEAFGRIDGLVDTLGQSRAAKLERVTDGDWDWHFDVGLRHVFLSAQIGIPKIAASGGGTVVYVGSVSSMGVIQKQIVYGAMKAALEFFVKSAAVEFGPQNVRVNSVVPGTIRTPRILKIFSDDTLRDLELACPLGRVGIPADIAASILFLSTDLSRHITGQHLVVDGGVTAKSPLYGVGKRRINQN